MLEFNAWFFVLLANFLILLYVLNKILFKPLADILKERDRSISGALDEAKAMVAKKDEAVTKMSAELQATRGKAKETSDLLRSEGHAVQKDVLSKAETDAVEILEKARLEIQAEAEKARRALRSDIEAFSEEIVKKLVKA